MKKASLTLTTMLFAIGMAPRSAGAQIYEDTQIRTWAQTIDNWNLRTDRFKDLYSGTTPPFDADKIASIKTNIYSDGSIPEVFNLSRLATITPLPGGGERFNFRYGGQSEIHRNHSSFNPHKFMALLNLKSCGGEPCPVGGMNGANTSDFFRADYGIPRQFIGSGLRAVVKVDYICTGTCGSETVHTMWKKLGPWNMQTHVARSIPLTSDGIPNASIIDFSTTIHSDPDGSGKINVDDFEHTGIKGFTPNSHVSSRGRGGNSWIGGGCRKGSMFSGMGDCEANTLNTVSYAEKRAIRYYVGPKERSGPMPVGSYRNTSFRLKDPNGGDPIVYPLAYSSTSINRGWTKIVYTGTKSSMPVPYAVKSKAIAIGNWNMSDPNQSYRLLSFPALNVAANRVMRIQTSIMSDLGSDFDVNGRKITNFHRPHPGHEDFAGGGVTFINEPQNNIVVQQQSDPNAGNFYTWYGHTGSGNRGFVHIDYLAGSCEQGISGFNIQAIPGAHIGSCGSTASSFKVEGSGSDIWNSADDFTFMSKLGSNNRDLVIRVDAQNATNSWARTGIMIRESQAPGARHASIFVTPSNGIRFTYRNTANQATQHSGANTLKAPYILWLKKSGTTFTAYARPNTSSSWQTIGTASISGFPGSNYYYGLAQTSKTSTLASSDFSSPSGF